MVSKSKDSLKDCFHSVNITKFCLFFLFLSKPSIPFLSTHKLSFARKAHKKKK